MVPEAPLERTQHGLAPAADGWFVVNAREAVWWHSEDFGSDVSFESEAARFAQVGINVAVVQPGQPGGLYHGEDAQEDFLVLEGECVLIVQREERTLRSWDFAHFPPMTEHIVVGAGSGPCILLRVGARRPGRAIHYPVNEAARRHGAGVERATDVPREAYEPFAPGGLGPYRHGDLP